MQDRHLNLKSGYDRLAFNKTYSENRKKQDKLRYNSSKVLYN